MKTYKTQEGAVRALDVFCDALAEKNPGLDFRVNKQMGEVVMVDGEVVVLFYAVAFNPPGNYYHVVDRELPDGEYHWMSLSDYKKAYVPPSYAVILNVEQEVAA